MFLMFSKTVVFNNKLQQFKKSLFLGDKFFGMIEIKKFKTTEKELFKAACDIRNNVFVIEQEVEPKLEFDQFEDECQHYLFYVNKIPIATARWRFIGEKIKLERFALLKDYRNSGYGSILLDEVLLDVKKEKRLIYLHAQLKAVPYYSRKGFIKKGEIFEEAGIRHYYMEIEANK